MKIFYIMECKECHHCIVIRYPSGDCFEKEESIPDIETIPDWCPLEDADKFIEWKRKNENE